MTALDTNRDKDQDAWLIVTNCNCPEVYESYPTRAYARAGKLVAAFEGYPCRIVKASDYYRN